MAILTAKNLAKSYGAGDAAVDALRTVSMEVQPGEFVAIMGPSGSGKSSLLTILGGVETPDSGQVFIEDQDLFALSEDDRTKIRRQRLGFIFQSFNLLPNLNATENVALPLELDGCDSKTAMQKARESLDLVEMQHRATHRPAALSGGEQQRVAIARALVIEPALLLADEPTGNLDTRQSKRISGLLKRLVDERAQTIVMVTHDMREAELLADRFLIMKAGTVTQQITRPDIKKQYPESSIEQWLLESL